jgi:HNH endonuclease
MRKVPLTRGKVALVDDEDYERVITAGPWQATPKHYDCWEARGHSPDHSTIRLHRLITGAEPGQQVDHINHDGLDNRRANLRVCTPHQNNANRRKFGGMSSRYKGVAWDKDYGCWRANGAGRYIGRFASEEDAARAYDAFAVHRWGDFALVNFPIGEAL